MIESELFDLQIILRGNFLGCYQVKARLCFAGVGDGGGAHLKVALGRSELLGDCSFLSLHKSEVVLRRQYVEVGLADTHHQVLFGSNQLLLHHLHLQAALRDFGFVARAVKGLRANNGRGVRPVKACEARVGGRRFDGVVAEVILRNIHTQTASGPELGLGLGRLQTRGFKLRLHRLVVGIKASG